MTIFGDFDDYGYIEYKDIERRECLWHAYARESGGGEYCAERTTKRACDWAASNIAKGLRLAALMAACEQRGWQTGLEQGREIGFSNGYDAACYGLMVGGA